MQEGSLASKLTHLRVGETIFLPDTFVSGKATTMERAVTTATGKAPHLATRRFQTERWAAVRCTPAEARNILAVTRLS